MDLMEHLKTVKSQVEYCLKTFIETRDSDVDLATMVWRTFYGDSIRIIDGERYYREKSLYTIARYNTIIRARAVFQNEEKMYLPTSWEVAQRRNISREVWEEFLGYGKKEDGTEKLF